MTGVGRRPEAGSGAAGRFGRSVSELGVGAVPSDAGGCGLESFSVRRSVRL